VSTNAFAGLRTLLFVPLDDADRARRAFGRGADAIILDLEDGVAPDAKNAARAALVELLSMRPQGCAVLVRVNALDTDWGADDKEALQGLDCDGVVVPKSTAASIDDWAGLTAPLLALVETASGLRSAHAIASHASVHALMLGAADLGAELALEPRPDGLELLLARSMLVVDSAAAGLRAPFDGVCLALRDEAAIADETRLAKSLGFGGKACIHPVQIAVVNEIFAPSATDLADAQELVDAFEAAGKDGRGALSVRGRMVDLPVVARARATLAQAANVGATSEERT
jgi:citrate lyase beta subunit